MDHWERLTAALKGEAVDRVPISLWRHFPTEDECAESLAEAMLRWQETYDFDLVKFSPTGTYGVEDWGAKTTYIPNDHGTRTVIEYGVVSEDQWAELEPLNPLMGYLGKQVAALQMAADQLEGSVPILQTIFSPLTTARKLAGERVFSDMRLHPNAFKLGLQVIAETTVSFAQACIKAGAHGMFFAIQCATQRLMCAEEYREFGEPFDRLVLDAVGPKASFNMVHIHGEDILFDLVADYPVEALNWHDRRTGPDLGEARRRFPGLVAGGINEWKAILRGPEEAIRDEIQEAITQASGRGVMVAPGCVLSTDTPEKYVRAAREAVES